ncbi:MAG: bifunctional tRNA (5-methylaminomethyl-2-thiouridine)(34)-methyltransferase MnmD/FAD-dependent 5-carboxymethylaminomethyl-2-thiouridine(34) oxidoreductase MnmC [Cellvibrionales bacterium]|nr:bifunctional tRNA (5-methylaminomethyl-2-thiouridine)(34)-methyltransferase MnmD/FAD-dependent 5-carboxymethylaminomethyl-2-thiouridine(34) oxidoreductase MnmC [Cellvibrionales bacterium]TXH49954.1 MAG: bifunctional tRNA (5-methylaminomethyl-2-thiouridine)(34)-methyltransferase MnmD/FAD-dependent 5-carboxymethylaminomethyl-2-thiouridine(34) oxidoreductase MnmC [Cellvibrionales bacterium]
MNTRKPLIPAQLHWRDDTPEAVDFGDIYFSRDNGLAESRHVFLDGNHLRERWRQLPPSSKFVIAETGFGTGLNFLLAWQLWLDTAPPNATLFFISTELHPLTHADLQRALSHWQELAPLSEELLQHYPNLLPGFHVVRLAQGRVTLLLLFGDAQETLPQLLDSQHSDFFAQNPWHVDAWFLDGFAPAKNPQLWQNTLIEQIASLSKTGTTLATFTAAGQVRRDLSAVGFSVKKISGYGSKREMLVATLTELKKSHTIINKTPWLLHAQPQAKPQHITVIGAGLAGCHIAHALAERGIRVTVLEQHAQAAQEASGNPQGALYTKLSANNASLTRFSLSSLQFALQHYQKPHLKTAFHDCGLLQLQEKPDPSLLDLMKNNAQLAQWMDAEQASQISGIALTRGGWWLSQSGWINPQQLCKALLDHPNINTKFGCSIAQLQRDNEHIIIACANASKQFSQTAWLPLRAVRGQITQLPTNTLSETLCCVVCDEGYLTPAHQQQHCLGASFIPDDTATDLRSSEQQHNMSLLNAISPTLHNAWQNEKLHGRAALRCTTPDHLPMVGALPNREIFLRNYSALRHNAKVVINNTGSYMNGLWVFTGFGGRGLCYIPLAAELLAAQLLHEPRPLPQDIQQALAPARFVIRELVQTHAGR